MSRMLHAQFGAEGTGLVTHARPAVAGDAKSEAYLTRPMLMAHADWRGLRARGLINLEGWTLRRGELNAGISGEGYVDRRHPHTYLHELMLTAQTELSGVDASLSAGRGFVPFGTDDPMTRPFVKYPANHHLAQILERWLAIGALRYRAFMFEAAAFNGDEPIGTGSLGQLDRFADSWAARATWLPRPTVELQGSMARLVSPEHAGGGGLNHRKWSMSLRGIMERGEAVRVYGLFEWARTAEYNGVRNVFNFQSVLAEVAASHGATRLAARFERTSRPEEERLLDPFRSARPHADENIIGVTRWHIVTARVDRSVTLSRMTVQPFTEVAWLHVSEITGALFEPVTFYGDDAFWSLSAGVRVGLGMSHERAGRYGVASSDHARSHE